MVCVLIFVFFFSSRRRHTRFSRDWSSDVCSSDLVYLAQLHADAVRSLVAAEDLAAGALIVIVLRAEADAGSLDVALGHAELLDRSEEHTSELQSRENLVCRLLLEKKK